MNAVTGAPTRAQLKAFVRRYLQAMRSLGHAPNRTVAFENVPRSAWLIDDPEPHAERRRYLLLDDGDTWCETVHGPQTVASGLQNTYCWLDEPTPALDLGPRPLARRRPPRRQRLPDLAGSGRRGLHGARPPRPPAPLGRSRVRPAVAGSRAAVWPAASAKLLPCEPMTERSGSAGRSPLVAPFLVIVIAFMMQSGSALATKVIGAVGVVDANWLRTTTAALILIAVRPRSLRLPPRGRRRTVALLALTLLCMNLSFYGAISMAPIGIVVAIEFSGPLVVAVLGSRRPLDFVWVALAAGGIAVLVGPSGSIGLGGLALALSAALFWGLYLVLPGARSASSSRSTSRRSCSRARRSC